MFEASHPGLTLRITYGSSGAFFAQIQSAAPFDVYLSADVAYARKLAELGLASPLDVFVYARGRLAVWAPKRSPIEVEALGLRSVLHPAAKRVAIANPRHAPYGRAAEAALQTAGLLDPVRPRLVYGENVAQAAQFVDSGAADLGLIALSLALSPALRDRGRIYEVPLDAYPSLEQGGVVLRSAREPEAARALRDFLLSGEAATTLRRFGFLVEER
jgi:molybdate transport system substrate-binding protein